MTPHVLNELVHITKGQSQEQAAVLVNQYFSKIIWSLEKQEFDAMSDQDKAHLAKQLVLFSEMKTAIAKRK